MQIWDDLFTGGGLPKLAPDLTYPSSKQAANNYVIVIGVNTTGALTTLVSLSGKFAVSLLMLTGLVAESITIKLTIDGVVIYNDTFANTATTNDSFLGSLVNTAGSGSDTVIQCDTSLLFEMQSISANAVDVRFLARPIL